jgi:hypothetical protein
VSPASVRAEFTTDDAVRLVDRATSSMLWRDRLSVPAPFAPNPYSDCFHKWEHHDTTLWWDSSAKVVLARLVYFTGGCMCEDYEFFLARRIP